MKRQIRTAENGVRMGRWWNEGKKKFSWNQKGKLLHLVESFLMGAYYRLLLFMGCSEFSGGSFWLCLALSEQPLAIKKTEHPLTWSIGIFLPFCGNHALKNFLKILSAFSHLKYLSKTIWKSAWYISGSQLGQWPPPHPPAGNISRYLETFWLSQQGWRR